MKRTLMAAAVALVMAVPTANATGIRVDNGRVLIDKGDRAGKLNQYLGRPNWSEPAKVCKKPSNSECRGDKLGWGYIYQYSTDKRNWNVEVYDGVITRIEWAR